MHDLPASLSVWPLQIEGRVDHLLKVLKQRAREVSVKMLLDVFDKCTAYVKTNDDEDIGFAEALKHV